MKRILIIEDDVSILSGLKDVLTFKSYEVLTAEDGETGYAAAVEEKPDLIILDIMIPKMDGFTLCRKLRAEGNSTPVLMLTAKGEEPDKIRGLDIGADDYVTKPFSLPELLARVRALLRRMPDRSKASPPDSLRIGDVSLNFKKFEATRSDAAMRTLAQMSAAPAVAWDQRCAGPPCTQSPRPRAQRVGEGGRQAG